MTSIDLSDNVIEVVSEEKSVAMRLIRISQQLSLPGRLPQATLKAIVKEERDNPCVMSVLQLLVLKRLYMYDTEHDDKHWAISTFRLDGSHDSVQLANHKQRTERRIAI